MKAKKTRSIILAGIFVEIGNRKHYKRYRITRSSWNRLMYLIDRYGDLHEAPYPATEKRTSSNSWYLYASIEI